MSKLMAYTTVRHVGTQKGAVLPLLPTALLPEASVCVPSLCPSLAARKGTGSSVRGWAWGLEGEAGWGVHSLLGGGLRLPSSHSA